MNRPEYTKNICELVLMMIEEGENPIGDFWKRSDEEQYRLWKIGRDEKGNVIGKTVTNCDGRISISDHQRGKGLDILFLSEDNEQIIEPKKGWDYWHVEWSRRGGKPAIKGDAGHFGG